MSLRNVEQEAVLKGVVQNDFCYFVEGCKDSTLPPSLQAPPRCAAQRAGVHFRDQHHPWDSVP